MTMRRLILPFLVIAVAVAAVMTAIQFVFQLPRWAGFVICLVLGAVSMRVLLLYRPWNGDPPSGNRHG